MSALNLPSCRAAAVNSVKNEEVRDKTQWLVSIRSRPTIKRRHTAALFKNCPLRMSIFRMHPHFDALAPHIGNQKAKHCHIISFTMGRPQHSALVHVIHCLFIVHILLEKLGLMFAVANTPQRPGSTHQNRSKHKCLCCLPKFIRQNKNISF